MSRSAGPGSPIAFRCARCRRTGATHHKYALTGAWTRTKGAVGIRSVRARFDYRCGCGYQGSTNHIDAARRAHVEGIITEEQFRDIWR